ncbi:MAG: DUF3761 domain-containing protein [Pseudonocardiaceae bacterium]
MAPITSTLTASAHPVPRRLRQPPPGATARCADGEYSFSKHHQGACSGHGGVAQYL